MIRVGAGIVIGRPAPDIFHFVTNAENDHLWVAFARSAANLTPGPVGQGTRFSQVGALMGLTVSTVWEIVEFEYYSRMVAQTLSGPAEFRGEYRLAPVDGGTWVTKSGEIRFSGWLSLAEPFLAVLIQNVLVTDLRRLKAVLEAPAEAPPMAV